MRQRLIRILVYEGEADWIQQTLKNNSVKGSHTCSKGCIKEAFVGDFLETLVPLQLPEKE